MVLFDDELGAKKDYLSNVIMKLIKATDTVGVEPQKYYANKDFVHGVFLGLGIFLDSKQIPAYITDEMLVKVITGFIFKTSNTIPEVGAALRDIILDMLHKRGYDFTNPIMPENDRESGVMPINTQNGKIPTGMAIYDALCRHGGKLRLKAEADEQSLGVEMFDKDFDELVAVLKEKNEYAERDGDVYFRGLVIRKVGS